MQLFNSKRKQSYKENINSSNITADSSKENFKKDVRQELETENEYYKAQIEQMEGNSKSVKMQSTGRDMNSMGNKSYLDSDMMWE